MRRKGSDVGLSHMETLRAMVLGTGIIVVAGFMGSSKDAGLRKQQEDMKKRIGSTLSETKPEKNTYKNLPDSPNR